MNKTCSTRAIAIAVAFILLCNHTAIAQKRFSEKDMGLADRIIGHCTSLSMEGVRQAGTAADLKAISYITGELGKAGLKPVAENVSFRNFRIDRAILETGQHSFTPLFISFDPFNKPASFEGEAILVGVNDEPADELEGRVVITNHPQMTLNLIPYNPGMIVCLEEADYSMISDESRRGIKLTVTGGVTRSETKNITVVIGNHPDGSDELLITAHYDSYSGSVGANDNATGTAAAIEMAGYLKSIEESLVCNVRIVFLGAEELGMIGSREYVTAHSDELDKIIAVINLDTFGGNDAPYVATAPGTGDIPASPRVNRLSADISGCAFEGAEGNWRIQHPSLLPLIMCSYYPDWLQERVGRVQSELGLDARNQQLMSDHLSFAQAGVPAISIQSRKHTIHSPADTVANLNRDSILACFDLAIAIALNISLTGS